MLKRVFEESKFANGLVKTPYIAIRTQVTLDTQLQPFGGLVSQNQVD